MVLLLETELIKIVAMLIINELKCLYEGSKFNITYFIIALNSCIVWKSTLNSHAHHTGTQKSITTADKNYCHSNGVGGYINAR